MPRLIVSTQSNPYLNIAVENYLLSQPSDGDITMYLWQNRRTVVIGQNQNPYAECEVELLESEDGFLMRRRTGGGAVFHDLGNLNFSFIVPYEMYDQARQFAEKVVDRNVGRGVATVSRYEFDDKVALQLFAVLKFTEPNDAWLDFVVDNRSGKYVGPKYDLKIGPVANDNVYTTIQLYMSGVLSRETAIRELKVRKLFNQVVFSSQRALGMLRFSGSEVVR